MNSEIFQSPNKIIFGIGSIEKVSSRAARYGKRVIIITGKSSSKKSGALDKLKNILISAGLDTLVFDEVESDPSIDTVEKGIAIARTAKSEVVIALGVGAAIGQVPELTKKVTYWVKEVASVPVIVKLTPNVTDITIIAEAAKEEGADGLAAINTVQCLIGVDLDTFAPLPTVDGYSTYGGYSGISIKPIGLRIISQLAKSINLPLSGMGGISTWEDAVEYMLLGAQNVQICTEVMLKGYGIIQKLVKGLEDYLYQKGFSSIKEIIGLSKNRIIDHSKLNRNKPLAVKLKKEWCTACGTCVIVCQDAGYNALKLDNKSLIIDREKCDGCSLCTHVCQRKALKLYPY